MCQAENMPFHPHKVLGGMFWDPHILIVEGKTETQGGKEAAEVTQGEGTSVWI